MSFKSILYDSSRAVVEIGVATIEGKPELFEEAFYLCKDKYPFSMRAARVVQFYFEKYPLKINDYSKEILDELLVTKVDGVKRSFLKILYLCPRIIDLEKSGLLLDKCLLWLMSDKEPIAVRAYCIDLLVKFAKEEPELKHEIRLAIENLPLDEYPSLKFRCKTALKSLILNS